MFINLAIFIGITNSTRILYNTSLLNESQAFLKSINDSCIAALDYKFFTMNEDYLMSILSIRWKITLKSQIIKST